MDAFCGKISLGIDGGHATGTCGCNGLAIDVILNVSGGKNAFNIGFGAARDGFYVAVFVQIEDSFEQLGVGLMADGHEESGDVEFSVFFSGVVVNQNAIYGLVAEDFLGFGIIQNFDVWGVQNAMLHGFGGTHLAFADNHIYLFAKLGEVGGLFGSSIAGTDDGYILLFEEKPVADSACRDSISVQALLGFQSQPFG